MSPEFVLLLGNPSTWHRSEKAGSFLESLAGQLSPTNTTALGQVGLRSRFGTWCLLLFPLSCTVQPITAPFLLGHHVPLISSAVLCAQTPSSLVRSPPPPLLPRSVSLSLFRLPPGGVSATVAATALFSLAMAFSIPFWQANLLLTKMLHLSHLHSLSVVIFSCFSFLLIYVSPWTPQVLLKDWSRTLQEQLSVSKYEFCCLRPRWAKR